MRIGGVYTASKPSREWLDFMVENRDVVWNMDCNAEFRDRLTAYRAWFHSDWFAKGRAQDVFEMVKQCPWRVRDLYQLHEAIIQCTSPGWDRFETMRRELGEATDQDGRRLSFGYLIEEAVEQDYERSQTRGIPKVGDLALACGVPF